jgi:hypothetical protein
MPAKCDCKTNGGKKINLLMEYMYQNIYFSYPAPWNVGFRKRLF